MSSASAELPDDAKLRALAMRLGDLLRDRQMTVVTAESCTGGWIAKAMTDVPGSSDWFDAGFVTYSNRAKTATLGVAEAMLAQSGAVSDPVVRAMADGVRRKTGAACAIAVSGIAGPGGGSDDKPVGLVWFAWALPDVLRSAEQLFAGDREAIRRQAVAFGLEGLIEALKASVRPAD